MTTSAVLYILPCISIPVLIALVTIASAQDIVEKRAQGVWIFAAQNNGADRSPECANQIEHRLVLHYKHIAPKSPNASVYATRWRYLTVNDERCSQSRSYETATIFLPPPARNVMSGAVAARYTGFFLLGEDNSPRRCGTWIQSLPARYYFTEDLPRYREVFEDAGFLSPGQNDSDIMNAEKGQVFMMSQQFNPASNGAITSRTACFYKKLNLIEPSPEANMSTQNRGRRKCFPANAVVELQNGLTVTMQSLRIGDIVRVDIDKYSPVFFFSHRHAETQDVFVRITLTSGNSLRLSAGHYVRLASGILRPAADVCVGDVLLVVPRTGICTADTSETCTRLQFSKVTNVEHKVEGYGLYAPHTLHGDIIVDGVLASSYTTAVSPWLAHTLLTPLRALWTCCALPASLDVRDLPERVVAAKRVVELAVHAVRNLHLT